MLTRQDWLASTTPIAAGNIVPLLKSGAVEFRDSFGDAFLVARFNPEPGRSMQSIVTLATIDITTAPAPRPRQAWVYMVASSTRSAFNSFISIGRAKNTDIIIDDASVSRFHALILPGGIVFDGGSRHGTFVDGQKAPKQAQGVGLALKPGSLLRVGNAELTYANADTLLRALQAM